jgi:hypothetical protein
MTNAITAKVNFALAVYFFIHAAFYFIRTIVNTRELSYLFNEEYSYGKFNTEK